MKRILILSITAGEGHNSTARAMKSYFDDVGVQCSVLDAYGCVSRPLRFIVDRGYLFASAHLKTAFGFFYHKAEKRRGGAGKRSPSRIFHKRLAKKLTRNINAYEPDAIICTHTLAAMMEDIIRRRDKLDVPRFVCIVTDFTLHPYWEECTSADALIVASDRLTNEAVAKGFAKDRIYDLGIPIGAKFSQSKPKEEARREIGFDESLPTVLIMGGSMGHGHISRIVRGIDELDLPLQLVCVCGRNEHTKKKIEKLTQTAKHNTSVLGFVDNIDLIMDASDMIVSKPGGLSTSEALAKRLPMIIFDPIPGHEVRNCEFLKNAGAALVADREHGADECVKDFLTDDALRRRMEEAIEKIRRPDSARDVCEFVLSMCEDEKSADRTAVGSAAK